jgi:subtilisin family serine protease
MWKLRIDPQPPAKYIAQLQPGIVGRTPLTQEQPAKDLRKSRRVERQQRVIESLLGDETVDWAYPAYRNTKTGTLLWLTPRLIIGVDPVVDPGSIEERLPPELRVVRPLAQTHQYVLELIDPRSHDPLAQAARLKEEHAWIQWAEPDFIQDWRRASTPNDALFPNQWHLQNTGQGGGTSGADARLPGAWDVETGNGSVVIAVIDDGVQTTHPDLPIYTNSGEIPGNGVDDDGNGYIDDVNGWDFFYNDNDPNPDLTAPSHGTAVAGVAAAKGDNSVGVSGACQNCSVLSARVFNATNAASNSAFAEAITYAGEMAHILNNSWGGGSPSTAITTAIQGAVANGRGGLGSPTLISSGNSASGYILFELSGFTSGTWTITWTYHKDTSFDRGFDTAWLDAVTFPDGTTEDFEGCTSLPSGWTSGGDANWVAVNDGTRAASVRGGRCSIRAGSITHNETSSVSVTRTFATDGSLFYRAWPSCETKLTGGEGPFTSSCWDWIDIKVNDGVTEYGPFLTACATYSNQGKRAQLTATKATPSRTARSPTRPTSASPSRWALPPTSTVAATTPNGVPRSISSATATAAASASRRPTLPARMATRPQTTPRPSAGHRRQPRCAVESPRLQSPPIPR